MSPHADPPSPAASVRRARPDDLPALSALQSELDAAAPALLEAAVSGTLGECLVAVALDADSPSPSTPEASTDAAARGPVGYLLAVDGPAGVGGVPGSGDALAGPDDGPTTHVAELVVAPDRRRRGHASALLATLVAANPHATVTLTVAPDNDAALALYEGFGFETVRRLPDFFSGRPGLLLARRPRPE